MTTTSRRSFLPLGSFIHPDGDTDRFGMSLTATGRESDVREAASTCPCEPLPRLWIGYLESGSVEEEEEEEEGDDRGV